MPPRTIFLNGTVGVGKTSTAQALARQLENVLPHAVIDTDTLRNRSPPAPNDPFDLTLELQNLAALSANYRESGSELLIVSGVIETLDVIPRYAEATGVSVADFLLVRLKAPLQVVEERINARRHVDKEEREWHLRRAPELDCILDAAGLPGVTIDAHTGVEEVVLSIRDALGV
jgi:adenylylsulfate kinase-like enzyme